MSHRAAARRRTPGRIVFRRVDDIQISDMREPFDPFPYCRRVFFRMEHHLVTEQVSDLSGSAFGDVSEKIRLEEPDVRRFGHPFLSESCHGLFPVCC